MYKRLYRRTIYCQTIVCTLLKLFVHILKHIAIVELNLQTLEVYTYPISPPVQPIIIVEHVEGENFVTTFREMHSHNQKASGYEGQFYGSTVSSYFLFNFELWQF